MKQLSDTMKAFTVAFAIRQLGRFGKSLVKASSDAVETRTKFEEVFQGIGDEANKAAEELAPEELAPEELGSDE